MVLLLAAPGFGQFAPTPLRPMTLPHREHGRPEALDLLVTDAAGRVAAGLTAADFSLESAAKARIESCDYIDTSARRTIVFLVDDLGLTDDQMDDVRAALARFIQTLQPGDRVAILRGGSGEGDLDRLTGDRELLGRSLARLYYNPRRGFYSGGTARANAFNTAVMVTARAAISGLESLPGRKSLVLLSPGLANLPVTGLDAIEAGARQAWVAVYAIDPAAAAAEPVAPAAPSRKVEPVPFTSASATRLDANGVAALARATGGQLLNARDDLYEVLARTLGGPDGYYRIRYTTAASPGVPGIQVARPGIEIRGNRQAPETSGDFAFSAPPQGQDDLAHAISELFLAGQIRTTLTPVFYNTAEGSMLAALVHLDVRDLSFRRDLDGIYHAAATVLVAAFGASGSAIAQQEWSTRVDWDQEQYQNGLRDGIEVTANLPVSPGAGLAPALRPRQADSTMLQLRAVAGDQNSGRMGSASDWLEVPSVENGGLALSSLELTGAGAPAGGLHEVVRANGQAGLSASLHRFHAGEPIVYHCEVYNLTVNAAKTSQLELQVIFYRDGKIAMANHPAEISLPAGTDPKRSLMAGQIRLPAGLAPGRYVLRFAVTDKLAPAPPPRIATQFADLELEP